MDRERAREASRRSYRKHHEKNLERSRRYRAEYPEKHTLSVKRWRDTHPEAVKAIDRRRYQRDKEKRLAYTHQSFTYKGKHIHIDNNPRKGQCAKCGRKISDGEIKKTNIHHTEYIPSMPLAMTEELCVKCHNVNHEKKRDESGRFVQEVSVR